MRILVAEDDPRMLRSLIHILETEKYTVDGVQSGGDALAYAETGEYDGLVLDIMMPELDGITVLKTLRSKKITTPVLFLTARTEVAQRVEGLDAGADDYLTKPFAMDELLARVRAMLRRRDSFVSDVLTYCGVTLDRSTYDLTYQSRTQTLSSKEYRIVNMLMSNPRCIISTEQLITRIWGYETDVDTNVVWVHMSNVRKKLLSIEAPIRIRYLRGAGYILEEST